ncbi:hypothetical protein [Ruegeria arenilitoris]|uniref:hypothetical protein n=1 Tax=Ruegeria arenilitoris TaxID=1173585 RepID=UPI001481578C|nr:hypothetical protein [Ruegeria arenilitoris]
MSRPAVWIVFAYLWWTIDDKPDDVLKRYAHRYWSGVDGLIKFGLATTAIFLVVVIGFALDGTCKVIDGEKMCEMRFLVLMDAPANEIGDTLAGLAGGLAFLWLVVTVLLQGKELAAQRKELELTRLEMMGQREAAQNLALAAAEQADLARQQNTALLEERASATFDRLLLEIRKMLLSDAWEGVDWLVRLDEYEGAETKYIYFDYSAFSDEQSTDDMMSRLFIEFAKWARELTGCVLYTERLPMMRNDFRRLFDALKLLDAQYDKLPQDKKLLCNAWMVSNIAALAREVEKPEYWADFGPRRN